MYRLTLLLTGVLLVPSTAAAQSAPASGPSAADTRMERTFGEMAGQVIDQATGDGLPTATVSVWSLPDSSLVSGTIADENGRFSVARLDPGQYYVQISFVGYAPFRSRAVNISATTPEIDFEQIRLSPEAATLQGVEITAERAEVTFEIDRTVYSTRDQIASTGGNATDVLQNIPSIEVDVDGNVSLRGSQNVGILINGKPAPARGDFLATFLQQISADMIDRVEIIPNPSAKFDPEGMAGMINIVLKKGADLGTSGGLTLSTATDDEYNASGSFNLQRGALTLFSNYGFRHDDRTSTGYNLRENRYLDPLTTLEQESDGLRRRRSHVGSVSADYALSDRTTLSASALVSRRTGGSDDRNLYLEMDRLALPFERFDRLSDSDSDGTNMDFSAGYRRVVEPSRNELVAELRYNSSVNGELDAIQERALGVTDGSVLDVRERTLDALDRAENEWTAQADWTRPIAGLRVESGYKGTLRSMENTLIAQNSDGDAATLAPDLRRSNAFDYSEQVQALYALASAQRGAFEMQAGIRAERAWTGFDLTTTGESFDNAYTSLFPSAAVAWKPSPTGQLRLSYSKRVNRPSTRMLNPFTTYTDPLNLYAGNPYLQPEYTHAVELGLQRFSRNGSLSFTPYFRRTVNEMQRYKTVNPDGTSLLTFRNFDRSDSYGAEVVGSLRLGSGLSGFASFNAFRVVTDASNVDDGLQSDALSWSARANLTWAVRDGLDVQAFYFYRAPRDVAQGRISSFQVANLSVRQKLWNDRAALTVRVSDPLNQMGFRFELDNETFYQLGERNWQSRSATVTLTVNFGQAPRQKGRRAEARGDSGMGDIGIN